MWLLGFGHFKTLHWGDDASFFRRDEQRREERAMSQESEIALAERHERLHPAAAYALSLMMVAAATLAAILVDQVQKVPNLSLIFVLPVIVAAVSFGWGPALGAAVAGVVAFNFFLIAPLYSLNVADPANL
jgi:K+-sensing histidine kinase KdpD